MYRNSKKSFLQAKMNNPYQIPAKIQPAPTFIYHCDFVVNTGFFRSGLYPTGRSYFPDRHLNFYDLLKQGASDTVNRRRGAFAPTFVIIK